MLTKVQNQENWKCLENRRNSRYILSPPFNHHFPFLCTLHSFIIFFYKKAEKKAEKCKLILNTYKRRHDNVTSCQYFFFPFEFSYISTRSLTTPHRSYTFINHPIIIHRQSAQLFHVDKLCLQFVQEFLRYIQTISRKGSDNS